MSNEVGDGFREAFKEHLEVFGEDFHAGGETRRGVFSDDKGVTKVTFPPGEFAIKPGDVVTRWASEEKFTVVSAKPEVIAGTVVSFDVFVRPR